MAKRKHKLLSEAKARYVVDAYLAGYGIKMIAKAVHAYHGDVSETVRLYGLEKHVNGGAAHRARGKPPLPPFNDQVATIVEPVVAKPQVRDKPGWDVPMRGWDRHGYVR